MKSMNSVQEIVERNRRYVFHGGRGWEAPIIFVGGEGCIVNDISGKEYIDCFSGCAGPLFIGWKHPRVVEAIKRHAEFPHSMWAFINIQRVELAEKLARIAPLGLNKTWFGSNGGDAVENAIKGAMLFTGKKEVISLYNAYHGQTIAMLGLMQPAIREGLPPIPGFRQIPPAYCYRCFYGQTYPGCDFECARALEAMIKYGSYNDVAAFIIEPVQGSGGHVYPPDEEYSKIIMETCEKHDVVIIADEVQTGLGRTGKMWGCECIGLQPDIMCLGKPLGGGLPISATIFREELAEKIVPKLWAGMTHSGGPLVCAAASATLDVIVGEKAPEKASKMGDFMTQRLKAMWEEHDLIGDVRGPGLFIGVELVKDRQTKEKATDEALKTARMCLERGVWVGTSQQPGIGNVIKIKPAFVITEEQASKALSVLDSVLTYIEKES